MIQSGSVRFLKRMKTGDYEHEEAQVDLAFNVPDGAEDGAYHTYLNRASQEAVERVRTMLRLTGGAVKQTAPVVTGDPPVPQRKPKTEAPKPAPKLTVDPLDMGLDDATEAVKETVPLSDGASVAATPSAQTGAASDDVMEDMWAAEAPEITDKALTDACAARNAQLKNAKGTTAIRALIAKFVPPPGQVRQIPQAQRQTFLDELKAIQVAA